MEPRNDRERKRASKLPKNDQLDKELQDFFGEIVNERDEQRANQELRGGKKAALSKIREKVQLAKKEKLRTVQQYLCDGCDAIIPISAEDEVNGYIIHGNIYVADPSQRAGIIGDNFPEPDEQGKIVASEIREEVFCRECLLDILQISQFGKKRPLMECIHDV
jgi:hypothetical protein